MDFRPYVREHLPRLTIARESEIVEELAQHLEDIYREQRDAGLDHAAAWARATGALPAAADDLARALRSASRTPPGQAADRVRAALDEPVPAGRRAFPMMIMGLRRDLRYAVRTLLRESGFTAVIVITLALGIGGTAAVFSAVDAVLLKSAPVAEPDRVVSVYTVWAARATANPGAGDQLGNSSYPDYADLRDSGVLGGLATFAGISLTLDTGGLTERIDAQVVSGNYFDVIGVRPAAGRTFSPEEDRIGSPVRVAVLSHRLWQRRFGGDPAIVGRSIALNGNAYAVIGVAARGFSGSVLGDTPEVWVPMALQEEVRPPSAGAVRQSLGSARMLHVRDVRWLSMLGRVKAGASITDTAAALDVIGRRLAASYPESNRDLSATAVPLGEGPGLRVRARPVLWLLTVAVILVLMIACANVAGLLLARAVTRRREVAVRMAIGAGRAQLVQQWLTEAVILGVLGAAGGLIVARLGAPILYGFGIPEGVDLSVSSRVMAFTLVTGVATGLIFGLAPVLQLIRRDTLTALRDEGGAVATGARATRLRSTFVVLQVALSLVLLVGAGLFLRTVQRAYAVDLGYRVDRMLVAEISPSGSYSPETGQAFYAELLGRLNAVPGVEAAGAARVTVLSGSARTLPVSVDGQPLRPDRSNAFPARANVVSEGYLEAMGIPVVRGRGFQTSDVQTLAGRRDCEPVARGPDVAERRSDRTDSRLDGAARSRRRRPRHGVSQRHGARSAADLLPPAHAELRVRRDAARAHRRRSPRDAARGAADCPRPRSPAGADEAPPARRRIRSIDDDPADDGDVCGAAERHCAAAGGGWPLRGDRVCDETADNGSRSAPRARRDAGVDPEPDRHARRAPHRDGRSARLRRRVLQFAIRSESAFRRRPNRSRHLAGGVLGSGGDRPCRVRGSGTARDAHRSRRGAAKFIGRGSLRSRGRPARFARR